MKVNSPLANMEIGIGEIRRRGSHLILRSEAGSSMDAEISVSASEVLRTIGRVLATPSGLVFVLGLPVFWLREKFGAGPDAAAATTTRRSDINKPW
jgi:hypothetical protein